MDYYPFFLFVLALALNYPLHLWSLRHQDLEKKHGQKEAYKFGRFLGISANIFHLLILIGFWFSFQPRFDFYYGKTLLLDLFGIAIYLSNFLISLPFLIFGLWFLIDSEQRLGEETLMGHLKPKKIISSGSYSIVRHPQYLGSNLVHLGMSLLLAGVFSLAFSPIYFFYNFLTAKKEEEELIKEFGNEYKKYQKKVPMFVPRLRRRS